MSHTQCASNWNLDRVRSWKKKVTRDITFFAGLAAGMIISHERATTKATDNSNKALATIASSQNCLALSRMGQRSNASLLASRNSIR